MRNLSISKLKTHTKGPTILITLQNERGAQPVQINSREKRSMYKYSDSASMSRRIPMILNILKKYKKVIFLGAIVDGQVMTPLDIELYVTLDHSVYHQFLNVINYNQLIIYEGDKVAKELLFPIHHSIATLTAMLSGPLLVRAANNSLVGPNIACAPKKG